MQSLNRIEEDRGILGILLPQSVCQFQAALILDHCLGWALLDIAVEIAELQAGFQRDSIDIARLVGI